MKNEEYILNEELEIDHKMSFLAQPGTAEVFFYLTRPLLLGEAPPLPRPPLLRRGLQPVNRLFGTRKQALALKGCSWLFDAQSASVYALRAPMRIWIIRARRG